MMALPTSSIERCAAARGVRPSSMPRSMFSTTTMASSTTMPTASTSPNKVSVLSEKPNSCSAPSVPTIDTGTAMIGIRAARQRCRKSSTTSTTSAVASSSVCVTAVIDSRTNTVGS